MTRLRAVTLVALVAIILPFAAYEGRRAARQAWMSNDEAGTIVAVQGILRHGVPQLPSGLIYYRSPMSHYLDALSTAILGDREIGWRGASLLAYVLTLFGPALLLLRRGRPLLALAWPPLIALMDPIHQIAWSARMYMVYTCFTWLSVVVCVFYRPRRFDRRGIAYAILCGLAALSHQHFVIFVPGLLLVGVWRQWTDGARTFSRAWRMPMVMAPLVGLALAALLHFGENSWFPRAFPNQASMPTTMGAHRSFAFPLAVIGGALPLPAWALLALCIAGTLARRQRLADNDATRDLVTILAPAYLALGWMLPNELDSYVAPLLPIVLLALFSVTLQEPSTTPRSRIARLTPVAVLALVTAIVGVWHTPSPLPGVRPRLAAVVAAPPVRDREIWHLLSRWVSAHQATVLTSEPEYALIRLPRVDYHVRNYGVNAKSPCDRIMDDGVTIPYAHSPCQLDQVVREADARHGSALFLGARLGYSIGPAVTSYIRTRFRHIGVFVLSEQVYCYGADCDELQAAFTAAGDQPAK